MFVYNEGMDTQSLLDILQAQSVLGRTRKGWDVGEGMPKASESSAADAGKDGFVAKDCVNCGIVLSGEFFSAGCPNCGCKDTKDFTDKVEHPVVAGMRGGIVTGIVAPETRRAAYFYLVDRAQIKAKEAIKGE